MMQKKNEFREHTGSAFAVHMFCICSALLRKSQ